MHLLEIKRKKKKTKKKKENQKKIIKFNTQIKRKEQTKSEGEIKLGVPGFDRGSMYMDLEI